VPERPEVETVVRDLRPLLVGTRLQKVRASRKALRKPWSVSWSSRLIGKRIQQVRRRGKWILLDLDDGSHLVVHLGMTGQLTVMDADQPRQSHTHLVFDLDDVRRQLRFRDVRRFGSATWYARGQDMDAFFDRSGLGPEPFDLPADHWQKALQGTTRCLKAVLLDQRVVAGVGNIYADESLFQARLHPALRGCDLDAAAARRLGKAVPAVLERAIDRRGSTIRDYVGGSGLQGGYQEEFLVYGRTDEPCRRCGTPIACLRLAGRSSHYCPRCQPADGLRPRRARKKSQDKLTAES
jgi:formamidopyrimidine-DNA glycosylase